MKLLVLTQKIDKNDTVLGFFHGWMSEFATKFERINVVCLGLGSYDLPENVQVHSLGKESGESKLGYIIKFFRICFFSSLEYNAVFVHMNQEYVLLGGLFWKMLGKKVYLWRNHPQGSWITRLTVAWSDKVFYTSKFSYTSRFDKAVEMPVGIDVEKFKPQNVDRKKNSILFLGRMAPIKNPRLLLQALIILEQRGVDFRADFYGDPLPKDWDYYDSILKMAERLGEKVQFNSGVSNDKTVEIYNNHQIFVNLTPSGSFDKTILEAAACGCVIITINQTLAGEVPENLISMEDEQEIASKIMFWLEAEGSLIERTFRELQNYVSRKHSLDALAEKLKNEMK